MEHEKQKWYVVYQTSHDPAEALTDFAIYAGRLETSDDIDTCRATLGDDVVILNWKRLD